MPIEDKDADGKSAMDYLQEIEDNPQETWGETQDESVTIEDDEGEDTDTQPDDDDQSSDGDEGSGAEGEPDEGKEQSTSEGDESKGDGASGSDGPKDESGSDQEKPKTSVKTRPKGESGSSIDWNARKNELAKQILRQQTASDEVREEIDNNPVSKRALLNSIEARASQKVYEERTTWEKDFGAVQSNRNQMDEKFGSQWTDEWQSEQFASYLETRPKYVQETIEHASKHFDDFESVAEIFQGFREHSKAGEQTVKEKEKPAQEQAPKEKAKAATTRKKPSNPQGPISRQAKTKVSQRPGKDAPVGEHLQYLLDNDDDEPEESTVTYL